jgi:tetraacyldisaccharide 4'-kinase
MIIFAPLGWVYGRIMQLRNAMYDRGILRSYSIGAKNISVGNITTGGTGKTPLVAYVATLLAENGEKVCVLSRGYGRQNKNERVLVSDGETVLVDAETGGDEPVELARKLLGKALVVAVADRVAGARWAIGEFGVTAFVLDDAFQHRRAKRDLDIVCIDATDPFGNGRVLPSGRLRESIDCLKRASAVVITRSDLADSDEEILKKVKDVNPNASTFKCMFKMKEFHRLDRPSERAEFKTTDKVFAFCALGNPQSFYCTVRQSGANLAGTLDFPDHHNYDGKDVSAIETAAKKVNATALITTAKDAVKLEKLDLAIPCFVVEIETVIDDPAAFRDLVLSA